MNLEKTCITCGNTFEGRFCNQCGEKIITRKDRTLSHFLGEFFNALFFVDNKFWRSVKTITLHPGQYSHAYSMGNRVPYMKPISLFFLANLIYFLFPLVNTFTTSLDIQTTSFVYSDLATQMVDDFIHENYYSLEEYRLIYDTKTTNLSKILLIVFAVIASLFFKVIHIGSDKNLWADHFTFGLEMMSFLLLIALEACILIIGIFAYLAGFEILLTNFYLTGLMVLILGYIFYMAEKNFYGFTGWRRILNTVLNIAGVFLTLIIYRGLLFFITFWSIK